MLAGSFDTIQVFLSRSEDAHDMKFGCNPQINFLSLFFLNLVDFWLNFYQAYRHWLSCEPQLLLQF